MKKLRTIKLGTVCRDRATDLDGTITHWVCDMEAGIQYLFQPKDFLNPDDGLPVKRISMEGARLVTTEEMFEDVNVPFEILGTPVTDKASGFTGMAVALIMHINGCFHVAIQPKGVLSKTNSPVRQSDFDLRHCHGPMIAQMQPQELAESKKTNPSPCEAERERFTPRENN